MTTNKATALKERFPLAEGISAKISEDALAIHAGQPNHYIEQLTPVTAELIKWWFQDDYRERRSINFHKGQRDAILAIIYAHEILGTTNLQDLYEQISPQSIIDIPGLLTELTEPRNQHPKYAAKMATGTGKTWVLNALLIWQYLNHKANPGDPRFTNNFLIVAPGLIVYDRLLDSFQGKIIAQETAGHDERETPAAVHVQSKRDFETSDIYSQRDLFLPDQHQKTVFNFIQNSVVEKKEISKKITSGGVIAITNWHLLVDKDFVGEEENIHAPGQDIDAKAAARSFAPLTPGMAAGNELNRLDAAQQRGKELEWLKNLPSLMVFNDEAHHVHSGGNTEVEWQKSLNIISENKGQHFVQIDFSATPYNERRGTKHYFRHIVVDFDLLMAMNSGLVKSLVLDKRHEVTSLSNDDLEFKADRDEAGNIIGLSEGQKVMISAGLEKLKILEQQFEAHDPDKHPKLMIMTEDTKVSPFVEEYLETLGYSAEEDILRVDSNRKGEMPEKDWAPLKEKLFGIDKLKTPKIIISVLMLREGFDVNNICVIVPLRSAESGILAEQTVGRGLRLMWRGDDVIDELKKENRELIRNHKEPSSYLDVLFIVEHPRFEELYKELLGEGQLGEVTEERDGIALGDLLKEELKPGYKEYDFNIPIILQDAEEEIQTPRINISELPTSKYPLDWLAQQIGKGEQFSSHEPQSGTSFGQYPVEGLIFKAVGYNEYLLKMARLITGSIDRVFTKEGQLKQRAGDPLLLQVHNTTLIGWLDRYIKTRYFGPNFDPFEDEKWRLLMHKDVQEELRANLTVALVDTINNIPVSKAEVQYRKTSEITSINVREGSSIAVKKAIYNRLPIPKHSGGFEKLFLEWANTDSTIQAVLKIDEYKHTFLRRPYLKSDGMLALYSPDFLVKTDEAIYVVETKAQSALSDANVQRKRKSATEWLSNINQLEPEQRENKTWHYVLLGEHRAHDWQQKNGTLKELLEFSKLYEQSQENDKLFE